MVHNFQKPQGYESGGTNFMSIVTYKKLKQQSWFING